MAIIYSYPQVPSVENSDLFIVTRFENEERGFARNVSLTADTLASYIAANHASNLNQVLEAGNESLLDAKIGDLYLWDITNDTYSKITSDKDRINFYGIDDDYFDEMGAMEVEGGTEEWMDVVSEITGKDAYDNSNFTDEDNANVMNFIRTMEAMGIELI
jgi:hypothetical protein